MDQLYVEIYANRSVGHGRKRNAAVLPQTSGDRRAADLHRPSFLRVATPVVRLIDLCRGSDIRRRSPAAGRFRMQTSESEHPTGRGQRGQDMKKLLVLIVVLYATAALA